MADPNWLLSTIAQSSAALVAIVAGFLLTKVLSVASERAAYQKEIDDLAVPLAVKKARVESIDEQGRYLNFERFIDVIVPDIVDSGATLGLDQVMIAHPLLTEVSTEQVAPYWDDSVATIRSALILFGDDATTWPRVRSLEQWLHSNELDLPPRHIDLFKRVLKCLWQRHQAEQDAGASHQQIPDAVLGSQEDPSIRSARMAIRAEKDQEEVRLRNDVHELERRTEELQWRLRLIRAPRGLGAAGSTLVYFALSGIVVPIALLPASPEKFGSIERIGVILIFLSGLARFALFVRTQIREISSDTDT